MKLNLRKYAGTLLLCCLCSTLLAVGVPPTPPAPSLVGGNYGIINTLTPTITGTAGVYNTITIFVDDNAVSGAFSDISGNYTAQLPQLSQGLHTIKIRSTDLSGNLSLFSDVLSFRVDTQAPATPSQPTVSGSILNGNSVYTSNIWPAFTGTAEPASILTFYWNGQLAGTTTTDASGNYSFSSAGNMNNGSYEISVTARDTAGNISAASDQLSLVIDDTPPVIERLELKSPGGSGFTSDITPEIGGNAYEPSLTITLNWVSGFLGTTTTDANGKFTFTFPFNLSEGSYFITADATDIAGNMSGTTSQFSFTIDITPPVAPSAPALMNNVNGSTRDATPDITGTAEASSTITVYADNINVGTATADLYGDYTFTLPYLIDGTHSILVKATDMAGNTSAASALLSITIDTNAPSPPSRPSIQGSVFDGIFYRTNNTAPTLVGTADANSIVTILCNGEAGTTTTDNNGQYSFTFNSPLQEGVYTVSAKATDAVGNSSNPGAQVNMFIDTTPPTVDKPTLTSTQVAGVTRELMPRIAGTAGQSAVIFTVYLDNVLTGNMATGAGGTYAYTFPAALSEGPHDITVTVADMVGNVSTKSTPLHIVIDTTPPAAPPAPVLLNGVNGSTGNATPDFTGTSAPNSVVHIYVDHAAGTVVTADANGAYAFTLTSSLADGPHVINAVAFDPVGNESPQGATLAITVDTQAPARPSTPTIPAAVIDGTFVFTNDATPTLNGTAEANSIITVLASGKLAGSTTTDASGNYSFTFSGALSDGGYGISVNATDAVGNISTYANQLNLVVDTQAPDVWLPQLTSINNDGTTVDVTPDIKGSSYEPRVIITVYADGVKMGTTTTDANGDYAYSIPSSLPDGPHTITVTGTDLVNNTSTPSAALNIIIDTRAPNAPATPVLTAGVNGSTPNATPDISGNAEANSVVTIYSDNVNMGTATANANGDYSFTFPASLNDGPHAITVKATDKAGNTSVASAILTITVDTQAPAPPSTPTIPGAVIDATWVLTNDATPTLNGSAEANSVIAVSASGELAGTTTTDASGHYSYTFTTPLRDGNYGVSVNATDAVGNTSFYSVQLNLVVDTRAPDVTTPELTSTHQDGITADVTPDIKGTLYEPRLIVTIYVDGVKTGTTTTDADSRYTYAIPSGLSDGPHAITITATDAVGNISVMSDALNIIIDTTAPTAPSAPALVNGVNGQTNDATPDITGNAEANSVVTIYANNVNVGSTTASGNGDYNFTFPANLSDGPHAITVKATDKAGNTSAASGILTITADTQAPAPPSTPTVTGAVNDGVYMLTKNTAPTLNGTAEANSVITVLVSGKLAGTTTTDATGHYSFTFSSALSDGGYGISLTATDAVGNISAYSAQLNLMIDTRAPEVTAPDLTSTHQDGVTTDVTPNIKGTLYEPRLIITIYVDGVKAGSTTTDANSRYTYAIPSGLSDGPHTITITAADVIGNTSVMSDVLNIIIDTTAPTAPSAPALVNGVNGQTNDATPDITGNAEANSVVTIYVNNVNVGSTAANSNGNYSFTIAPTLADGSHAIKVTATDKVGNTSLPGAVLNITIDTKAPDAPVLVLQTSNNNGVIGIATPVITGTAEANSKVSVYADGIVAGTTNADATGNYTYTFTTPLPDGTHNVTTNTADVVGNISAFSLPISFRVDVTAPTVTLSIPANSGDNGKPVTVTITFSEAVTGFNAAGVNVSGGEATGFIAVSPTVYTIVVAPLTGATANVTVAAGTAVDSADNSNQASNTITLKSAANSSISMAYPMPATDRIHVRFDGVNNGTGTVSMTSVSGQVILKEPATISSGLMTVNVQRLPAGTYVLLVFVKETNMTYNRTVLIAR